MKKPKLLNRHHLRGSVLREVPITYKVNKNRTCINDKRVKLTKGKKYLILERSIINGDYLVECDSGRKVWYGIERFK